MTHQTRYRILLGAALFSLVGELPIVLSMFSANAFSTFPAIIGFTMFAFIPICGMYAFVGARRELRNIHSRRSTPEEAWKMRLIAIASAGGTIMWLPVAALVILLFFPLPEIQPPREAIINDLNNIAAQAYSYRLRPGSMGGGEGSYLGFQIPTKMRTNGNGSYRIVFLYPDSIVIEGQCERDIKGAVRVKIDSTCRLTNWQYFGDMDY